MTFMGFGRDGCAWKFVAGEVPLGKDARVRVRSLRADKSQKQGGARNHHALCSPIAQFLSSKKCPAAIKRRYRARQTFVTFSN
jgi:hypothetical protein